ncbi:MAG: EFR1 family ferrodoxin [Candidatus Bathyarchaeia archaeon]|jgi:ferredoxin
MSQHKNLEPPFLYGSQRKQPADGNLGIEIFYFSGTGNSLVVARDLAKKTNATLTPIVLVMGQQTVESNADAIGVVFPVFYATNDRGIPLIIRRFLDKLKGLESKYVFAVCTSGYMPGSTIENLRKDLEAKGGKLAAGFNVRMGSKRVAPAKQQKMRAKREKKLTAIGDYVVARKTGRFETRGAVQKILLAPLHAFERVVFQYRYRRLAQASDLSFMELVPLADLSFRVNEKCVGCGVCARVCPVNNIKLVDGKPVWLHHCETCYACYAWCPEGAIGGDIVAYNDWYRNPEAKLSDMLAAKRSS